MLVIFNNFDLLKKSGVQNLHTLRIRFYNGVLLRG